MTTAANWPQWRPSSLSVSGATDYSARPGEQVTEAFRVAGRRGRVRWTVREREAPRRWVIEGTIEGRRIEAVSAEALRRLKHVLESE